jgi:hypothetical protein
MQWIALCACLVWVSGQAVVRGNPVLIDSSEARVLMCKYKSDRFSGLAHFKDKWWATCANAVVEFSPSGVARAFKWNGGSTPDGLWVDRAHDLLWVQIDGEDAMGCFDGTRWRIVNLPKPKRGYFTRGEVMVGFHGVSNANAFWVVGADSAWRYSDVKANPWTEVLMPWTIGVNFGERYIRDAVPLNEHTLYLVGAKPRYVIPFGSGELTDAVIAVGSDEWHEIKNVPLGKFTCSHVAAAGDTGYLLLQTGDIISITGSGAKLLGAPGKCEALNAVGDKSLIGCFPGLGIYRFNDGWSKVSEVPYVQKKGWRIVEIAGNERNVVMSVSVDDVFADGLTCGMWILDDSKCLKVPDCWNR